ncbi:hypothetical protein [Halanaerobium sp. MA284_MarDTE_T2]|uniref:hypothetical protein n=1 Tax=Halanaerobium sp. MA284_MarDTE_T2 TaxID=2183913 RepID=UPI000E12CB8F|nr:hypothetical protein [Halanaerobium sp. MA284_MarDTE_T2]RCW44105.1 uncharacterized protein DUF2746 [Halanaerobium sp. MA284_MarDTE_T2]
MDQELLDSIREIVCEETKKIVREETRKIVREETRKIVREETADMRDDISSLKTDVSSLKKQVSENTLILRSLEENNEIRSAQMDRMENDIAHLLGKYEKVDELEDRFIHHTHTIVIETGKPEEKAS